jgi:polysaccharide pyruvyl transferase WcaK-like protein
MPFSLMLEWGGVSVTLSAVYRGGVGTRLHKAVLSFRFGTAACLKAALSLLSFK